MTPEIRDCQKTYTYKSNSSVGAETAGKPDIMHIASGKSVFFVGGWSSFQLRQVLVGVARTYGLAWSGGTTCGAMGKVISTPKWAARGLFLSPGHPVVSVQVSGLGGRNYCYCPT